ncbi:DUF2264 domain-containing protein [Williamsia sp. CHRR-6]|uniref:DUF2264 domain-containing protein n=1 Tax=Williamsia sp. CHRR-6 TaxID=2835871 RepID=UPI001BD989E9|nr:DUF2264 domain-containing protein [Williamsia sp. CHRR-6]MBT0567072.1 DUF2264 domain-containing protein [Williamsia sp. CHRR-6]
MTTWTRADWIGCVDRLLAAVEPYRSPGGARIDLPGPASCYGPDSDGLEGFSRTFLAAALRTRGEQGADPGGVLERYARGLAAGTDPGHPEAWPRPDQLDQAKVEAASIALGLQLTRPWLWDRLDGGVRARTIDWLSSVVGQPYPPINWVWFQVVVESFLREVGGEWSRADIDAGLAVHATLRRPDGWRTDRDGERSYDHYVGWALHLFPQLWVELFDVTDGPAPLCPATLVDTWRADLRDYLTDAVHLVGADGSPLLQGRSLIYRFAAAAQFWLGGWTGTLDPAVARRAAGLIVRHFDDRITHPLTLGLHHQWPAMRQAYSGPGSPYWAAQGFLGLALGPEHPIWQTSESLVPSERGDQLRVATAPGWLISIHDGLTCVHNHGTDHAAVGSRAGDAPLYARLGYSTATIPPLVGATVAAPLDNSVTVVDTRGSSTHRTGFATLRCEVLGHTAIGVSRARLHWVDATADDSPDHGSGRTGSVVDGPVVTVMSVVRPGVEIRVARVESTDRGCTGRIRVGGWPVSGASDALVVSTDALSRDQRVSVGDLCSTIVGLHGLDEGGVHHETDVTPLGAATATPWLATGSNAEPGTVVAALIALRRSPIDAMPTAAVHPEGIEVRWTADDVVSVRWPTVDQPDSSQPINTSASVAS